MIYGWTPITTPPEKTGRYIVCHRGGVVEAVIYIDTNVGNWAPFTKHGWQDLPAWGPTHWMQVIWPD